MSNDEETLRSANRTFYDAIEGADLPAMRRVWSQEQVITCVHPNCEMLTGWDDVVESWRLLFDVLSPWDLTVEEQRLEVRGDVGWVMCVERYELAEDEEGEEGEAGEAGAEGEGESVGELDLSGAGKVLVEELEPASEAMPAEPGELVEEIDESGGVGEGDEEEDDAMRLVTATHVFVREEGQWKLSHRHASGFSPGETTLDDLPN